MAEVVECDFPIHGLLPKKETGVDSFLLKYPEYDGRGIVMGIFDSGIDPRAPGLQVTSEGKPKIIERYDCSGSGDVDTSTVVVIEPMPPQAGDISLEGLTGRTLTVPSLWKNPSGIYHLGIKNAFDLYPSNVIDHMKKLRKIASWDADHNLALRNATKALNDFDKFHPVLSGDDKLVKEDLESQIDIIVAADKNYLDVGPAFDCIVWNDGKVWRACIDTSETGNLAESPMVGEYSKVREFATLTNDDQLSFSVNIYDNGNTLEIVTMCSSHGTHVASIAAGYFPDEPQKNGCAPGAQIVSLTIGDNRLGSMETGTALVRAVIRVMGKVGPVIDVINMSYGEHAHFSSSGRIGELMNEAIDKHGVVWVSAAGNHGPALCTIGTPPDISTSNIIGVGAYVSPDMMNAEYALWQKLPSMLYTWTSRGPTVDGDMGVTVCAPGAAITSVPTFTLRNRQLMNGTSMASPHVAGAIALMLSGLKSKKLSYSPYGVKRALEATALHQESLDIFAQGQGLLQVEKAFEHLSNYSSALEALVRFKISCGPQGCKGIHLRSGMHQTQREVSITVEPHFLYEDEIDPSIMINFGLRLTLTCNSSWVQHPSHLDLTNMSRCFNIKINCSGLATGVHFTSINAYDVTCVEKGAIFRVPVTVVIPDEVPSTGCRELLFKDVVFKPSSIKRHFILVPEGATWAVLKLRSTDKESLWGRFVIHAVQLRPKLVCKTVESYKVITITPHQDTTHGFCVRASLVLELVIAKYWASLGDMVLQYDVRFYGVKPDRPVIVMQGCDGILPIELTGFSTEEVLPVVSLKSTVHVLRPAETKVMPLTSRDIIPNGRQIYEIQLTYNFQLLKATEVTPNCPILSDMLYESEFESQLWMLYDSNKQLMTSGDAYPDKYTKKLEKGDYVIRLHVRHERKDLLEKLVDQIMLISAKLPVAVGLDVYSNQSQATTQGKKMISVSLAPKQILPVYIAPLANETRTSKGLPFGQYLTGTVVFAKDEVGKKVDTYDITYVLAEAPIKKLVKEPKDKSKSEEYKESIRDAKISWLSRLDTGEDSKELYEELKSQHPDHLPIHIAAMQGGDPWEAKRQLPLFILPEPGDAHYLMPADFDNYLAIGDIVLSAVNIVDVLAYCGTKNDLRCDLSKHKAKMESQKTLMLEGAARKGIILCRKYRVEESKIEGLDGGSSAMNGLLMEIEALFQQIMKVTEPTDPKVLYFSMWHAAVRKHYGRLYKLLQKANEDKPCKDIDLKLAEVAYLANWSHIAREMELSIPVRHPRNYRPF